ncbi:hypothetical protein [Natronosalvus caseinilyticus]|uniref:hypothetical protein n=1 Tax=Natronosalvus caseinilyticus TaxID=2953747 RepID=UPI0028AF5528|nr:hypothetical protein [Natronosalvus caseinilyticus]
MAVISEPLCLLCNQSVDDDEELEHHLLFDHRPTELAEELASRWEPEELGDFQ